MYFTNKNIATTKPANKVQSSSRLIQQKNFGCQRLWIRPEENSLKSYNTPEVPMERNWKATELYLAE